MRYFRSVAFDIGLALIVAGVFATFQGTTHHGAPPTRDATIRESDTDVSFLALPGGLAVVSGVGAMVVGTFRAERRR